MKTLYRRIAYALLGLAAGYLIAVNVALNLPATRDLINGLQPEAVNLTWRRAWSLYPLRVSLSGVAADGQTPTEQWQLDAGRVAVSVSLLAPRRDDVAAGAHALFKGHGLIARLHAAETDPATPSTAEAAAELVDEVDLAFELTIPTMQAPDLAVYQALLPAKWGLGLLGGSGEVNGRLVVTDDDLTLALDLSSDEAQVRYRDFQAITDLLFALRAKVEDRDGATLDLGGTRLRLDDAEVAVA